MLRYSLGSLFLALLYLSIACAALVNATGIWPQVAVTLTLAILGLFSLGAIFWTERRRVFALGFAATGWLYVLLAFSEVTSIRPFLLTESLTNQLYVTMHSPQAMQLNVTYQSVGPPLVQALRAPAVRPTPTAAGNTVPGPVYSAPVYSAPVVQPMGAATYATYTPVGTMRPFVDPRSFTNIGHSLWAVIVAFVGGMTAQLLAKGRRRESQANEGKKVLPA